MMEEIKFDSRTEKLEIDMLSGRILRWRVYKGVWFPSVEGYLADWIEGWTPPPAPPAAPVEVRLL